MKSFDEVIRKAKEIGPKIVAVAGKPDEDLQESLKRAEEEKIASHIVFDDAVGAVKAVRSGEADVLMKGTVDTKAFMHAILDKENGLRKGQLISHIAVVEAMGRLMMITDGGICLQPSVDEKVEIIKNSLPVARALGIETAKVAALAAVEKINPKMPETVDADELSKMNIEGCVVQGPLALDNAVSEHAAKVKGITGPVAGKAEILLVPSVLAGNLMAKSILYFAKARFGGLAAGASKPVCFLSRADDAETRFNTIALGVISTEYV